MRLPPLLLMALCAALAGGVSALFPFGYQNVPTWIVLVVAVAAGAFMFPAAISFARQKTTVNPLSPDDATVLVDKGIFGFSRNPMYVGMVLFLLAFALWLGTASGFIGVVIFFILIDRYQIRFEEEALTKKFGASYREYISRVPRWLIFKGTRT